MAVFVVVLTRCQIVDPEIHKLSLRSMGPYGTEIKNCKTYIRGDPATDLCLKNHRLR